MLEVRTVFYNGNKHLLSEPAQVQEVGITEVITTDQENRTIKVIFNNGTVHEVEIIRQN